MAQSRARKWMIRRGRDMGVDKTWTCRRIQHAGVWVYVHVRHAKSVHHMDRAELLAWTRSERRYRADRRAYMRLHTGVPF